MGKLSEPKITRLQLIYVAFAIVLFAIMNTKAFGSLSDWVKIAIYAGFIIMVAMSGKSLGSIQDLLSRVKEVADTDASLEEKYNSLMSIMTMAAAQLGVVWEKMNKAQGIVTVAKKVGAKFKGLLNGKEETETQAETKESP
jgi:hypothetical protein